MMEFLFYKISGEIKNVIMQEIVSGVLPFVCQIHANRNYTILYSLDAEEGTHAWTSLMRASNN
jgi:hypothetical protein